MGCRIRWPREFCYDLRRQRDLLHAARRGRAHWPTGGVFEVRRCNLWTGLERDRDKGPGGCSRWCDTDFVATDGSGGGKFRSPADLVSAVASHWPHSTVRPFVVCTVVSLCCSSMSRYWLSQCRGWFVAVRPTGPWIHPLVSCG